MANNPHLQKMFGLEAGMESMGSPPANAVDSLLMKIEDGKAVTDDDWGRIALEIAIVRRRLDQLERALLKARAEPNLEWSYDA